MLCSDPANIPTEIAESAPVGITISTWFDSLLRIFIIPSMYECDFNKRQYVSD